MTGLSRREVDQHIPDPVDCYTTIDEGSLAGRGVTQLTIVVILYTIRDGGSDGTTVLRRRMPYCVWCRLMASFPSGASACGGLTYAVGGEWARWNAITVSPSYCRRGPFDAFPPAYKSILQRVLQWDVDTPHNDGPTRSSSLEEQRDEAHRPPWIAMVSWQDDGLPRGLLGAHRTRHMATGVVAVRSRALTDAMTVLTADPLRSPDRAEP